MAPAGTSAKTVPLLGIDIGGTKISVCLGNNKGTIRKAKRIPVADIANSYTDGLNAIIKLCKDLLKSENVAPTELAAIGISAPGPLDTRRGLLLAPTNLKRWGHAPIVADLQRHFQCPTRMQNDANACALAEFRFGCGRRVQNLVYLTVSTGMGGGIICNGSLVKGDTDTAGEVGHMVLNPDGPPCACGQKGCFEAYCGGLSVARRVQLKIVEEKIHTAILDKAGGAVDNIAFPAILEALREGDHLAREVWEEFIMRLAQGIGIIIMTLNPEMIVLGTIAIHADDLLMIPLQECLQRFAWTAPHRACRIVTSQLGTSIGDYSALAVAMDSDHESILIMA
ncbi:MAG: ROK family protein [Kiritimatiellia bacterium]